MLLMMFLIILYDFSLRIFMPETGIFDGMIDKKIASVIA